MRQPLEVRISTPHAQGDASGGGTVAVACAGAELTHRLDRTGSGSALFCQLLTKVGANGAFATPT
jgi:hypothetical protein